MCVMELSTPRAMAASPWLLLLCVAAGAVVLQARAQPDRKGFISIDCGLSEETGYVDETTKLSYAADAGFIDAGTNHNIAAEFVTPSVGKPRYTVRSFEGTRNCYTLRSLVPGDKYIIRAMFMYGNYDGLDRPPVFDLYIGVNYWHTVDMRDPEKFEGIDEVMLKEAIVVVPDNFVQMCLVNTGDGTPFISSLELRPLNKTHYPQATVAQGLRVKSRMNFGPTDAVIVRYPDDPQDRIWPPTYNKNFWTEITTTQKVQNLDNDLFGAPSAVLQTAIRPLNASEDIWGATIGWTSQPTTMDPSPGYIIILHFAELQVLPSNAVRELNVLLFGDPWYTRGFTPGYLYDTVAYNTIPFTSNFRRWYSIRIEASGNATLPPFINAAEIFSIFPTTNVGTDSQDVFYFHRDLSGNRLSGSIPSGLLKRIQEGSLDLRYGNNPNLCTNGNSCQLHAKKNSKLALYIAVPAVLLVVIVLVTILLICLLKRKKKASASTYEGSMDNSITPQNETTTTHATANVEANYSSLRRLESRQFTYKELEKITNNFQQVLGRGGFGYVYSGFLEDGTQVAVKLRSHSSNQGVKEFLAEAEILTRIHHMNLVSMIGYCMDGEYMALVYEYISEGTLQEHIQGSNRNGACLSWPQRLRIALESAKGLEYLHKGCNPPIIHRDVKATNILLNAKLEARIADFGLSKAFDRNDHHVSTNTLVGTPGYVDPEYQATMQLTAKSDVYSFGVVLMELVTGKPAILREPAPVNIIWWAGQRLAQGNIEAVVDGRMGGDYDVNSVWKAADIALKCTAYSSIQRPTMTDVVAQLHECIELENGRAGDYANTGVYTRSSNNDPNMSYDAYPTDQSSIVSRNSTALETEHDLRRKPTMPTGPDAR
ncbi:hypothetical protein ACQ4PT_067621 [Festuca glaucescens]